MQKKEAPVSEVTRGSTRRSGKMRKLYLETLAGSVPVDGRGGDARNGDRVRSVVLYRVYDV